MKYIIVSITLFVSLWVYSQDVSENHPLLEDVKSKYQAECGGRCDTNKNHLNDEVTKGRIAFLNKDFSTDVFNKHQSVEYWYCKVKDENDRRLNLEIVSILFKNEADKKAAIKKIGQRKAFRVKVLTAFKVKEAKNELVFVYSDSYRNEKIMAFFKEM